MMMYCTVCLVHPVPVVYELDGKCENCWADAQEQFDCPSPPRARDIITVPPDQRSDRRRGRAPQNV